MPLMYVFKTYFEPGNIRITKEIKRLKIDTDRNPICSYTSIDESKMDDIETIKTRDLWLEYKTICIGGVEFYCICSSDNLILDALGSKQYFEKYGLIMNTIAIAGMNRHTRYARDLTEFEIRLIEKHLEPLDDDILLIDFASDQLTYQNAKKKQIPEEWYLFITQPIYRV